ncbi:MAG: hypothetical protein K8H84_07830 [Sulfuricella denitrificans]|nr:hypothetical protein [Sulfuricella denitrificans]
MKIYAQVDANKVCFSVAQLTSEVIRADMIELPAYDEQRLGQRWTGAAWQKLDVDGKTWIPA